ncbi:MAG: bifunctional riboflavin kinase/FAD synthetase [Deltaproteobacteria bacterium]|nr:bifunctional riboflavin kinase/FAD synthetase [Deltaproteobacteria bacterium]
MKVFTSSRAARAFCKKGTALAIGNYDGIHQGHRFILGLLAREAEKRDVPAVVYTFDPHPVRVLAPNVAPPLINTRRQKIGLLGLCGVSATILEKFTPSFSRLSAEDFFQKILVDRLNPCFVIVGYDFTFGLRRQGNIETLERLCFQNRIDVKIVEPVLQKGTLVSSSLIRRYVREGRIAEATRGLARPYFIEGRIIRGKQRGLGIPTANLKSENELIPREGVYATQTEIGKKKLKSVTNIGFNPTFGNRTLSIETHILGLKKRLVGRQIRLYFIDRIRSEKKFRSPKELVRQIRKDISAAKRIWRREKPWNL